MTSETRKAIYLATKLGDRVADWIATFAGSWLSVALHTVWFVLWFTLLLDVGLLTNAVSLEAIYLCLFLLMSQNRQGDRDRLRDDTEAAEVQTMADSHELLLQINQQQLEILEALQPKSRKVAKP